MNAARPPTNNPLSIVRPAAAAFVVVEEFAAVALLEEVESGAFVAGVAFPVAEADVTGLLG